MGTTAISLVKPLILPLLRPLLRVVDPNGYGVRWVRELMRMPIFHRELEAYRALPEAEIIQEADLTPMMLDRTSSTPMDRHYVYQSLWATQKIKASGTNHHVDIGSHSFYVVLLSALTHVTFVDIRPLNVTSERFSSTAGSLLALPFADKSVSSLSCLHVVEHVGLGRYGDPLDPAGTRKACRELARVIEVGGHLYFSVPVGKPRVCFNAHRVHSPQQILDYFADLTLVDFAVVDDQSRFRTAVTPAEMTGATYSCGMFHFTRSA